MNDYFIAAGAMLTTAPRAGIASVTIHAQTDATTAPLVRAAVIDFESGSLAELTRVVVAGEGWNAGDVRAALIDPLVSRGTCSLAEVIETLARGSGVREVHLFARWLPTELLTAALGARGIGLVAHPLAAIRQAALICGQTFTRLVSPVRAA
jgi:hypothetical protein